MSETCLHGHLTASALEECLPALRRFALRLTKNGERANDLVQDSVERALRKAHLFDGANLRSWMFTICRRVFLNNLRSRNTRLIAIDLDSAPINALSVPQTQEISLEYDEFVKAFNSLPQSHKVILSLTAIEGLKYEEAAKVLDVPVGTIRSRLNRARARLHSAIESKSSKESPAYLN